MKRFVAMLLVLVLMLGLFAGCGTAGNRKDSQQPTTDTVSGTEATTTTQIGSEQPTEGTPNDDAPEQDTEPVQNNTMAQQYGLTDSLVNTLKETVIFQMDQNTAYVGGTMQTMDTAPTEFDGVTYIPGAFTVRGLGGTAEYDPETGRWTMELNGDELTVEPEFSRILKNEEPQDTKNDVLEAFRDFLISTEDAADFLSIKPKRDRELLYIAVEPLDEIEDLPEDGADILYSSTLAMMMDANRDYYVDMNPSTEDDLDRHAISKIMNIDPKHVPYQSQPETLVGVCSNMYIEDFSMKAHPTKPDFFVCSMNVYNYLGYTYGVVEAYSKDDVLQDWKIVDAYDGQSDSLLAPITDLMKLGEDGAMAFATGNWEYLGYKNQIDSAHTHIEIEVPKDGYIFVTNNHNYSKRVSAMNAVRLFELSLKACASTLMMSGNLGMDADAADLSNFLINAVEEKALNMLHGEPSLIDQLSDAFDAYMQTSALGVQLEFDNYAQKRWGDIGQIMDEYGISALMIDILKTCTASAESTFNIAAGTLISAYPGGSMALAIRSFIIDAANIYCTVVDMDYTATSEPVIFEACDWRGAYASFLRSSKYGSTSSRFFLCYISDDSIPELVLIDGSSTMAKAEVYTYIGNEVVKHPDTFYATYGSFIYAEYLDMKSTSTFRNGWTNTGYSTIFKTSRLPDCTFNDNVDQDGAKTEYWYNGEKVGSRVYYKEKNKIESQFTKGQKVAYYDDGHKVTEENIRKYIEKNKG